MEREITQVLIQSGGIRRYGGTECIGDCILAWLEGETGRMVIALDDDRQAALTPKKAFTKRSKSLSLEVEFKR